ncbi:hypothetical protein Emag_000775 [Eimeria magna]
MSRRMCLADVCPGCLPELEGVVKGLPMPHRLKSHLICPVTGEPMDEDNPPMASPEGRMISKKGLAMLASQSQPRLKPLEV